MNLQTIQLTEIIANPNQPRKHFDEQALTELSESIKSDGLMQPITVRNVVRDTIDYYEIVQGERRFRASKLAGLTEMQAFVQELSDEDAFHLSVVENVQREQMTPIEEANAFMKYVEMGFTHAQIAEKVSKSRTFVTSRMRMLQLMPEIQDWIADGKLSEGHAKQILAAKGNVCRIMDVCRGLHGTEDAFIYFQRLFMVAFKESEKISVTDVKDFAARFKYLLVSSNLTWLTFQAYPPYISDDDRVRMFALKQVTLSIELGSYLPSFESADVIDMFDYAIEHKDDDEKLWEFYKAREEWEEFMVANDFSLLDEDELVDILKGRDLISDLNVY